MLFSRPDLTTGSRPVLLPDETLLFVQNNVGLYEGKYKIATCQNGQAYLTSHRACYVNDENPRENSLAINLRDVDRHEFQARFLRSSPKVTLFPKPLRRGFGSLNRKLDHVAPLAVQRLSSSSSPVTRTSSPLRNPVISTAAPQPSGTWVCPICAFSNPVPSNFDSLNANESFPLPPCLTCGVNPPFAVVLKAAITAASRRSSVPSPAYGTTHFSQTAAQAPYGDSEVRSEPGVCPRCTFHNHSSLQFCEMCGAQLRSSSLYEGPASRSESPGPQISALSLNEDEELDSVKFSFRAGGEKVFYERLKSAMVQRKWLLQGAPPIPRPPLPSSANPSTSSGAPEGGSPSRGPSTPVGIAGLEQRGLRSRKHNETVIGTAFEDLEALMASAKDIVALAEKFAKETQDGSSSSADAVLSESAAALGMITTKDMLGGGSETLYISELARNLAEYVADDSRGLLRRHGGIVSLIDLWAIFNRDRNGVELVSPSDFHRAVEMWEKLGLPVRLRQFKSGLLAVQRHDWTDDKTVDQFRAWLSSLHTPSADDAAWNTAHFGRGVTAQDAAQRYGWSLGVATEELQMAEDWGVLCREAGVEGVQFWLNHFLDDDDS